MFGVSGKKKVNFEQIFSSATDTWQYLYGDSSKTVSIFSDNDFIDAWLSSKNVGLVTQVIRAEALKDNIPSLRQMIWLCGMYFQNVASFAPSKAEELQLQIAFLKDRVEFCEKAIHLGLVENTYYAMVSCANLYTLLTGPGRQLNDKDTVTALNGIVKYATLFLASGENDPELIEDANQLLKQYSALARLTNSINDRP